MKTLLHILTTSFIVILFVVVSSNVKTQWQTDIRLTNNLSNSRTSPNNTRCIVSSGDTLHVVWIDNRDGNSEIYYKRSIDQGSSWGSDTRLTNNISISLDPSISVSTSEVHVVWEDNRDGNLEIYYKRSTNGGISWESDIRLINDPFDSKVPTISSNGSVVNVFWSDERNGNFEIYNKRSADGGVTWGTDIRLTNNTGYSVCPSVSVFASALNIVWSDNRDGNYEIYYKRSIDWGLNWGQDTRLTNNSSTSDVPSISTAGSFIHVVWYDERDGNREIYYKRSTDQGANWSTDTRITNNIEYSWNPNIIAVESSVHIVWHDGRDGNSEIYYKFSSDGGANWGADYRLTNDPAASYNPFVSVSGSFIHVVWHDNRDGNYEIYYKRNPTGNPIRITSLSNEIPKYFLLEQNYPNPFNPSTKIRFSIPAQNYYNENIKMVIFDVLGREVKTLLNEIVPAGIYEINFDANELASGNYYYQLTTGSFSDTKKMMIVK